MAYSEPSFYDFVAEAREINEQLAGGIVIACTYGLTRTTEVELSYTDTEISLSCVHGDPPLRQQLAAEFRRIADFYLWMAEHVYSPSQAKPEKEGAAK